MHMIVTYWVTLELSRSHFSEKYDYEQNNIIRVHLAEALGKFIYISNFLAFTPHELQLLHLHKKIQK